MCLHNGHVEDFLLKGSEKNREMVLLCEIHIRLTYCRKYTKTL